MNEIKVELIVVGERARKDYGDINDLKNSISRNGLLHPIVIDDKFNLIAGGRRYEAVKILGWETVPIRLLGDLTPLERLEVELEENLQRKDMTWQETLMLVQRIDKVKRELYGSQTPGMRTDTSEAKDAKWGLADTAREIHQTPGNVSRDLQLARAMGVLPELHKEESKVMAFRMLKRLEKLIERELLARQTAKLPPDQLPFRLIHADAKAALAQLADESVQCVVTSPPYFNQRDYGVVGQLGLEVSPAEYIKNLADVFDELLHRVLKRDGVVWVNLDDTYADENKGGAPTGFVYDTAYATSVTMSAAKLILPEGTKKKDLVGIPWMFAFEMRSRGWWLRSCVIWSKSSSTPEGTTDRPVNVHEYIFMFSKADVYKFNNQDWLNEDPMKRKLRSVWNIDLVPTGDSGHIAAFPEELPRTCILASTDENDVVLDVFNGSGASGAAALMCNREYIGFDLNEEYIKASDQRLRAVYAEQAREEEEEDEEGGVVAADATAEIAI